MSIVSPSDAVDVFVIAMSDSEVPIAMSEDNVPVPVH